MPIKFTFICLALTLSSVSQASLYCGASSYGTPSETSRAGAIPYRTVQVDAMGAGIVQIDIQDDYGNGAADEVIKVELINAETQINEIAAGTYTHDLKIIAQGGKIKLSYKNWDYNCEDPAL